MGFMAVGGNILNNACKRFLCLEMGEVLSGQSRKHRIGGKQGRVQAGSSRENKTGGV